MRAKAIVAFFSGAVLIGGSAAGAEPAEDDECASRHASRRSTSIFDSNKYESKNVSFVGGAVVLNPFKLESVDTDADPATKEFRLETGNTSANGLVEVGLRRRWAWEEWAPEDRKEV